MEAVAAPPSEPLPEQMLDKNRYMEIRSHLSFEPDYRVGLLVLLVNHAIAALGVYLLREGSLSAYVAAQFLFPIVFFQAFSVLHDCGHGSFATRKLHNSMIGHYASLFCFMPYFPWKYQHAIHHAWTGHLDNDPTLKMLKMWRDTGKIPRLLRFSWRTWIPLGAAMQHLVFWSHPIAVWRSGNRAQLLQCAFSVLWIFGVWTSAHLLFPETFTLLNFAPAIGLYLVAVELVNLPHHADRPTTERRLALWEQGYSSRSCYYPRGVSEFFVLNFNFHIEHHLFPSLPWYRLRQARERVRAALGSGYEEAVGVEWNVKNRSTSITEVIKITANPKPVLVRPPARADRG